MNNQNAVPITKEGLVELQHEYDLLVKEKRPEAIKRVADARDQGDLSENSEYSAARDDLNLIEGRIAELEEILHKAELISTSHSANTVDLGCKVTLNIDHRKDIYTIVGEWEADPKERKISHTSPLGKALMGKKVGEHIEVEAPAGKILYKILHIE